MKIALLGYGKMGKTIEKLASEKGHEVIFKKTSTSNEGNLENADVAIDFSSPETAVENIKLAIQNNVPIVSGTTGWLESYSEMVKFCETSNGSFLYASNFSIGVNLFFEINKFAAKIMAPFKDYTVSIEEIHHTEKKDAPSGTAITLAEGILEFSDKKSWNLNDANSEEIKIDAKRLHDVKGTHNIDYVSKIDTIRLSHEAHSRDGFALGAILAAEYIKDKKGVFTMKEVLNISK